MIDIAIGFFIALWIGSLVHSIDSNADRAAGYITGTAAAAVIAALIYFRG